MRISKKFFRLRRTGRKRRGSGYYWIHWSYRGDPTTGDVWRIGYYLEKFDTWTLPGDARIFKDVDFIAINEHQVAGPFTTPARILYYVVLLVLGWNFAWIMVEILKLLNIIK